MSTPLLELRDVSMRFQRRLSLGEEIAARIGAGKPAPVVRGL